MNASPSRAAPCCPPWLATAPPCAHRLGLGLRPQPRPARTGGQARWGVGACTRTARCCTARGRLARAVRACAVRLLRSLPTSRSNLLRSLFGEACLCLRQCACFCSVPSPEKHVCQGCSRECSVLPPFQAGACVGPRCAQHPRSPSLRPSPTPAAPSTSCTCLHALHLAPCTLPSSPPRSPHPPRTPCAPHPPLQQPPPRPAPAPRAPLGAAPRWMTSGPAAPRAPPLQPSSVGVARACLPRGLRTQAGQCSGG